MSLNVSGLVYGLKGQFMVVHHGKQMNNYMHYLLHIPTAVTSYKNKHHNVD